ncbi:hypothetical protein F4677DRAFT_439919 [Hypoxylon crocopeplum]|nr:hypothetical protein F4677DRAFT_439919 [Hypoxylon crocopeplum]
MAPDGSTRRTKSGFLPGKFRNFVNDMKRFKIHRHGRRKTEGAMTEPAPVPESPQVPQVPQVSVSKPVSSHSSLPATNLAIQVTITFDEPLNYSYTRNYETSPSLQATEALCQGLLRRVDHCCHELITRKDSTAMEYAAASGSDKPLRYEIQIDIIRGWSEIWASRTFKSYQKQLLSAEAAREIIISTHYIVGLFLRRHDQGFVWKDGPVRDDPLDDQGKFPHRAGRVQPLSCVPRSYFLEKPQSFESVPGYTINFSFTSRCQRRKPSEWHTTVEVNSGQTTPLNSIVAESLFFEASYALEGVLRSERQAFESRHRPCASLDGCKDCRHHDNDGLELQFSIANNLGPQFPHLERTIHCSSNLSLYSDAQECLTFVNRVEAAFAGVQDDADDKINQMNDLEFRITELRGHGWSLDEPLVFVLDPNHSYSLRSIEAILDRIQAGVADILRGNAISVRMTAHKRGHFILDKTFVARDPFEPAENRKRKSPRKSKDYVLGRLRQRIERDIEIFSRDTLTLDDTEETGNASEATVPVQIPSTQDADVTTSTSGPENTESISRATTEEREESSNSTPYPETSSAASASGSMAEKENPAYPAVNPEDTEKEYDVPSSPSLPPSPLSAGRPPIPLRRSSVAILCSNTGARAFPLVPGLDDYVAPDGSSSAKDSDERDSEHATSDEPTGQNIARPSSSGQSSLKETKDSEEEKSAETTNIEEPESMAAYEASISSSAPSLVFGGGSSPSSSILITPKINRLSTDVDYSKNSIVDSDDEDSRDSESTNGEAKQDLAKVQLLPSPTLRHAAKQIGSSPLRVSQTVPEQSNVGLSKTDTLPLDETTGLTSPTVDTKELEPVTKEAQAPVASLTELHHTDASTLVSSENTRDAGASETSSGDQGIEEKITNPTSRDAINIPNHIEDTVANEHESHNADADNFAQSKPDFIFSSPPAATPDTGLSEEEDEPSPVPRPKKGEMSPDPPEDFDSDFALSPPMRKALGSPRRSFGSAGVLGMHEQMFGSLSLRTALMHSRPTTSYFEDVRRDEKRPGTAM